MILWHFLTPHRLQQKIDFATVSNGELVLHPPTAGKDISNGALGAYLYCLPALLSGMNFGDLTQLAAIKIQTFETARVLKFRGDPRRLDYTDLRKTYDLIDMTVDDPEFSPVRFRQVLLLNISVVADWTSSFDHRFDSEFDEAYESLQKNSFKPDDFFMIDFSRSEALSAANMLGHLLWVAPLASAAIESEMQNVRMALQRVGTM